MNVRLTALLALALALLPIGAGAADEPDLPEGVEVQARGPVHEAFAEATGAAPGPGPVVEKEPPAPIEEMPPEEKPEGDNIVWIPGYWGWDEEASDFLWVSGFWRAVPPGRTWVPGRWEKTGEGHVWVSGYWADEASEGEEELVPEPPGTLERGPTAPPPAEGYNYMPGQWVYHEERFAWRPGYWLKHRPGWCWVPGQYKWTPAGYVHVSGYWDAPLAERGLLYAPVRVSPRLARRKGFVYTPAYAVQPDFLMSALFVRKATRRYHFGDYFGRGMDARYEAWPEYRLGRWAYDPNYSYYRRANAGRPGWEKGLRALYEGRASGDIPRPPVTLVQQRTLVNNYTTRRTTNVAVSKAVNITNGQNVTAVSRVSSREGLRVSGLASLGGTTAARDVKTVRVQKVSADSHREERRQLERHRLVARERQAAEGRAAAKRPAGVKPTAPVRLKMVLPKTAPPRPRIKAPAPPPAPVRPKVAVKPPPGPDRRPAPPPPPPRKDRDRPPVVTPPKVTPPPPPRVTPPPRKDRDRPPVPPKVTPPKVTPPAPPPRATPPKVTPPAPPPRVTPPKVTPPAPPPRVTPPPPPPKVTPPPPPPPPRKDKDRPKKDKG